MQKHFQISTNYSKTLNRYKIEHELLNSLCICLYSGVHLVMNRDHLQRNKWAKKGKKIRNEKAIQKKVQHAADRDHIYQELLTEEKKIMKIKNMTPSQVCHR